MAESTLSASQFAGVLAHLFDEMFAAGEAIEFEDRVREALNEDLPCEDRLLCEDPVIDDVKQIDSSVRVTFRDGSVFTITVKK